MQEKDSHTLPVAISAITVQKKNKERYSLYADGEFVIGVSESTLIELELAKGVVITPLLFKKIQRAEGRYAVKSYLLKLLARRAHARKELLTKAQRKDYAKEVIRDVLDELEQKGYVNEEDFARKFAADKANLSQWGPAKIRAHLLRKGISRPVASQSIDAAFKDFDLAETLLNLVLKKKRRFLSEEDLFKRKKKILDYLLRKGFRPNSIYNHIDDLLEAIAR